VNIDPAFRPLIDLIADLVLADVLDEVSDSPKAQRPASGKRRALFDQRALAGLKTEGTDERGNSTTSRPMRPPRRI
jgi:hypothetical protein